MSKNYFPCIRDSWAAVSHGKKYEGVTTGEEKRVILALRSKINDERRTKKTIIQMEENVIYICKKMSSCVQCEENETLYGGLQKNDNV